MRTQMIRVSSWTILQSNLAIVEANPKPIAIISLSGSREVSGDSVVEITLYRQASPNKTLHVICSHSN